MTTAKMMLSVLTSPVAVHWVTFGGAALHLQVEAKDLEART